MLNICIDATPISPQPSGVGFYVSNLIRALQGLQESEKFELGIAYQPGMKKWLVGDWSLPISLYSYPNPHILPIPVRVSNFLIDNNIQPILSALEGNLGAPGVYHGTNYTVYPCQKSLKVMTIYDVTFIKHLEYVDSVVKSYAERVKRCLKWTDLVLTISESSKIDIVNYLKVDPNKIYVTPLASRYSDDIDLNRQKYLTSQTSYDFSIPYLLFVSTLEPRKNINSIITAFNYLKSKHKIPHQLILIGRYGWSYQSILIAIKNSPYKNNIHHLKYLSDELVALFYSKADVFVYPSYYEGFGLPVLEAMTLGTPVVTSNTSSLPEVTGDAALLIDPHQPMELAESILKLISDPQLRQQSIDKGRERAKTFSWERTANETLIAYKTII